MPNETATPTPTSCSAWQQTSSTNSNNNSKDKSPTTALLTVRNKNLCYVFCNCLNANFYFLLTAQQASGLKKK